MVAMPVRSDPVKPGETVLLQGGGLSAIDTVYVRSRTRLYDENASDWVSAPVVPGQSSGNHPRASSHFMTGVSFRYIHGFLFVAPLIP